MWPTLGTLTDFRIGKREVGVHMDGGYIIRERIPKGPLLIFLYFSSDGMNKIDRILKHLLNVKRVFDFMNERIYSKDTF